MEIAPSREVLHPVMQGETMPRKRVRLSVWTPKKQAIAPEREEAMANFEEENILRIAAQRLTCMPI